MKLRIYPDPVLLKKAMPVKNINDDTRRILDDMLNLMYESNGVGLAAPQVGLSQRMLVIDISHPDRGESRRPLKMINPTILKLSEEVEKCNEGCLSLPEVFKPVERSYTCTVDYTDEHGNQQTLSAEGFLARAIQHEIDHLNGIVFIDHLSPLKKKMAVKRLEKILKHYQ